MVLHTLVLMYSSTSTKGEASVFMHMEPDRKGGSRDLILEADLGGHG